MSDPTSTWIAERQASMTHILATPFEMMRAMQGHPIVVTDAEGNEVLLRLPTEDEAVEMYERACHNLGTEPRPEGVAHARQACKAVKLP